MSNRKTVADLSPLGLWGFSTITLASAAVNCHFVKDGRGLLFPAMYFVGGLAQVIAGIADLIRYEHFGGNVFSAFGMYWITEGMWSSLSLGVSIDPGQYRDFEKLHGAYRLCWVVITVIMFIATTKISLTHMLTLASVVLVVFTAAMEAMVSNGTEKWQKASGFFQFVAGILAFYISLVVTCREMGVGQLPMGWVDPVDALDKEPARKTSRDLDIQEVALPGDTVVVPVS